MLLSIIIPVYNVEKYIQNCLESVDKIQLTKEEYEIIVVNDGTRDNSMKIVARYQNEKNLHIINQSNKGLSAARNNGLIHASGEWVYFLDSDDYIDAHLFKDLFMSACNNTEVDIITGDFLYVKDISIRTSGCRIDTTHEISLRGTTFFKKYYQKIDTMVWRSIYRRSFLLENGLFFTEGVYHEDVNWTPKCIIMAKKVHYSPIPFYYYSIREGSIMQSAGSQKKMKDLMFVNRDLLIYFKRFDNEAQKIISYYVLRSLLALNGKYRLYKNKEFFDEMNSILLIPSAHNTRFKIVYFMFRTFPWLVNRLLVYRYGNNIK